MTADKPAGGQARPAGGPANPAGGPSSGLLDHLRELAAAGLDYLRARLALAGIEAKEALLHFGFIIALSVAAVSMTMFGYLFLCVALTVLIAQRLHVSPGWVILVLALVHFGLALGSILFAIARLKASVFAATLAELRKDQQWLSHASKQS
jgi:uncharacterized membrane protein YqjE